MNFTIGNRGIGDGEPVYIIGEAGVNHNGSLELAFELVDLAVEAGVDAVKFQTFKADSLNTPTAPKSTYHVETTGNDAHQTWYELLKSQELDKNQHVALIDYCHQKEITFLSTPYDRESVDLLADLGTEAFKVASTDTNNLPFLQYIASKQKPVVLSTAMCTMEEVKSAVGAVRTEGLESLAVLQCTGNYPASLTDANLRVMSTFLQHLDCIVGYSDHTEGLVAPIAATAMGAAIIEKHFTTDKTLPGPDHRMSLSPEDLIETVAVIRQTELALGASEKRVLELEEENRVKLRKSLVAARDICAGEILGTDNVTAKRPGDGLPPSDFDRIVGRKTKDRIAEDDKILEDNLLG
jgi:N,N'-diacetyllegionaminate synthase